jgi:hypothetical protein
MGCITGKFLKFSEENKACNLAFRLDVGRGGQNGQHGQHGFIKQRYAEAMELEKMSDTDQTKIEFEESSGNVFADLVFEDSDELFTRAQLGFHVIRILKDLFSVSALKSLTLGNFTYRR